MHVGTLLIFFAVLHSTTSFPTSQSSRVAENAADKSVGRLAFTLADPSAGKTADAPTGGTFMDILSALTKSTFFQKFIQYIGGVASPQDAEPKKAFARPTIPQADLPEVARNFEASLSHDDAIESVPSGAAIVPMSAGGSPPHKSINDEGFTQLLFGEKGVLTNVFHVMDAQRQNEQATMAEAARRSQADPGNVKIKDMDFAKVFDALLMGGQKKNEFGEPGPELPENLLKNGDLQFLGICNRLSCGDIYKAIDEFRRSDFFSNFQTALQLIQDPKGWEILGKMLSNPELIAQFTGGGGEAAAIGGGAGAGIGAGLSGMFGSALGGAKAAVAKEGGDGLTTKDGDFGTDFSAQAKAEIDKDKDAFKLPETSFSIDEGAKGEGAGEDYYSEIVTNIDEDFEVEDRDILGLPTKAATTTTVRPSTMTTSKMTTPERTTSTTYTIRPTAASTAPRAASAPVTTGRPSTTEDYGGTFEKSIDAMPPVDEKFVVDEKIPTTTMTNATMKPVEMLVVGRNFMETSKIMPSPSTSSTRQTTRQTASTTTTKITTPTRPVPSATPTTRVPTATTLRPIAPLVAPRAIRPVPVPVITPVTSAPLVIAPSTIRPKQMRRISIGGGEGPTQAPKNYRKESDYYSMYYDN
ncbi:hypothetical protein PRIPAC_73819 [Pristionchus pacificus]|uniref:Uncharacterized protein n=1 Tax=Pristionchus pacificus TaxID=54126 RepID=A0A2A6B4M2_PRIPA|nr:hypothetical protein PRIPAC_73819 [Pristionchus pacificus]|eukprot:PDM60808.1 hypothetical protein PRIPAC_54614 [Pristionchus pacificus]